jgi:DNA-binding HxlR family transcriptional regulator
MNDGRMLVVARGLDALFSSAMLSERRRRRPAISDRMLSDALRRLQVH